MRRPEIPFPFRPASGAAFPAGGFPLFLFFFSTALLFAGGCASPEPSPGIDAEWGRCTRQARAAFDAGDTGRAASLYSRALKRARAMDDAAGIADSAYNLAACLIDSGDLAGARPFLAEARGAASRGGAPLAPILLLHAEAARIRGRPGEAAALCREVLAIPGAAGKENVLLEVRLLETRLACDAGDKVLARRKLDEVLGLAGSAGEDPWLRARISHAAGRVLVLEGRSAAAAGAFDGEAGFLRQAGRYAAMAGALLRSGRAFLDAGKPGPAADRLYRAARSLFGQGAAAAAREAAESARAAAEEGGCPDLKSRIEFLLAEMGGKRGGAP